MNVYFRRLVFFEVYFYTSVRIKMVKRKENYIFTIKNISLPLSLFLSLYRTCSLSLSHHYIFRYISPSFFLSLFLSLSFY